MKLYSLQILYKSETGNSSVPLAVAHDLNSFGFFEKKAVKEFMDFTGKLVVERSQRCSRSKVPEQAYICHCYIRGDFLAGICISDDEYPDRVAQTLLNKVLEEFSQAYPASGWPSLTAAQVHYKQLDADLARYQDPKQADAMMRIQSEIDETKGILTQTVDSLLQRGEKLDDLVARSDALSSQSKAFYQTAKKTNRCCTLL